MIRRYYKCRVNPLHQDWVNLPDHARGWAVFRCIARVPVLAGELPETTDVCGEVADLYRNKESVA